ncbi:MULTISPECIES: hypothetical protein [unclassified Streptomyces]|uniref:hypothetical protein n=1 Tax=unclassified Streptomyces TaxID=2593676 RepID=UPI0036E895B9
MRQLSARVRWAAVIAVTVATSTGCMSVGDDGGKPATSPSSEPKGSVAGPDGETVAGAGGARTGGGAEAHSEREAADRTESAQPSGSASADSPDSPGRVRPGAGPGGPGETRGGGLPAPSVPPSAPGVPQQPESPPSEPAASEPPGSPEPEPEPAEPSPQSSASSAAQLRNDAMSALEKPALMRTPDVSPQVEPV